MGQSKKNPTPNPDLELIGDPVSSQEPHLAARPGEAAKGGILMDCIIITFTSFGTGGFTQEAKPVRGAYP